MHHHWTDPLTVHCVWVVAHLDQHPHTDIHALVSFKMYPFPVLGDSPPGGHVNYKWPVTLLHTILALQLFFVGTTSE